MPTGPAFKYFVNSTHLTWKQEGARSAASAAAGLIVDEARKFPRLVRMKSRSGSPPMRIGDLDLMPLEVVDVVVRTLEDLGVHVRKTAFDPDDLKRHTGTFRYPRFYAGGTIAHGGFRERKILEYFASLILAPVSSDDVVIDIASERSIFPDRVRESTGASVFRQDLIYRPGIHGDRIGGSAADIPIESEAATKLTLHNSFEHFEGRADTQFVEEACRVLKPGGSVCIVPLFVSASHVILTDPLVDQTGIHFDPEATVVPVVGYRNRFGRFYSPSTLQSRVLEPAHACGLKATIYNLEQRDPTTSGLHFALVLKK